jgi:hypothetical protein
MWKHSVILFILCDGDSDKPLRHCSTNPVTNRDAILLASCVKMKPTDTVKDF